MATDTKEPGGRLFCRFQVAHIAGYALAGHHAAAANRTMSASRCAVVVRRPNSVSRLLRRARRLRGARGRYIHNEYLPQL